MSKTVILMWFEVLPISFLVSLLAELFVAWIIAVNKNLNSGKILKGVFFAVVASYILFVPTIIQFPGINPPNFFFVMLLPEIIFEGAVISITCDLDSLTAIGISSVSNFAAFIAIVVVLKFLGF